MFSPACQATKEPERNTKKAIGCIKCIIYVEEIQRISSMGGIPNYSLKTGGGGESIRLGICAE